mmetsp:Transcript_35592/g.85989  ORF Transcript_35592/g.85989 Transcript_35592/m.85989 type:complete len:92 (-) Transcript_35592:342-617(-)
MSPPRSKKAKARSTGVKYIRGNREKTSASAEYARLLASIQRVQSLDAGVSLKIPTDLTKLLTKKPDGTFSPKSTLLADVKAEGSYLAFKPQ